MGRQRGQKMVEYVLILLGIRKRHVLAVAKDRSANKGSSGRGVGWSVIE